MNCIITAQLNLIQPHSPPTNTIHRTTAFTMNPDDQFLGRILNSTPQVELCRSWMESGFCAYGEHCHYSHVSPKKITKRSPLNKPEITCRYWMKFGHCKRGDQCRFKHADTEFVPQPQQPPQQYSPEMMIMSNPTMTSEPGIDSIEIEDQLLERSAPLPVREEDSLNPMWRRLMGRMLKLKKYQYKCTHWDDLHGRCKLGHKCEEHTEYMKWLKNRLFGEKQKRKSNVWNSPKSTWAHQNKLAMPPSSLHLGPSR